MRIDQFMRGEAVDSLSDALLLVGIDGSIFDANPAALDLYGCSRAEMLATRFRDVQPAQSEVTNEGPMQEAAVGGRPFETEHRRKDGSPLSVEVRSAQVGADGERALLYSVRDITECKRLEGVQQDLMTAVMHVIGNVSESRDPFTTGHQQHVSELAAAIAQEIGIPDIDIAAIRMAGLLVDIGKVSVPTEILNVAGQLSSIEFDIVKDHAEAGYQILASAKMEGPIPEMIRQHHERCDGSGYPRGLAADELLEGAKILMVADVVEAMCSDRPHRPALGIDRALDEIEGGRGEKYDPQVVAACFKVFRERGFAFSQL